MQGYKMDYGPHELVCREGDPSTDLYYLQTGKLLICTVTGTEVKAIARIGPGEFIGELSFFDDKPRASHIVTLEPSQLIQIPKQELLQVLPTWYMEVGKNLTKKIRLLDRIIHTSYLRHFRNQEQKPLSIEEQRQILALIGEE